MKITAKLGDFYPRPEFGWPEEPSRRCHILGSRVVQLQGGLGVVEVAARNGDPEGTKEGLRHIRSATEELSKGLPESSPIARGLNNRAKLLETLVAPYRYGTKLPKKISSVLRDQVRAMGDHEFKLERASIVACGGHPSGAHALYKDGRLEPLPEIPKGMIQGAKTLKASQEAKLQAKIHRQHQATLKRIENLQKTRSRK